MPENSIVQGMAHAVSMWAMVWPDHGFADYQQQPGVGTEGDLHNGRASALLVVAAS